MKNYALFLIGTTLISMCAIKPSYAVKNCTKAIEFTVHGCKNDCGVKFTHSSDIKKCKKACSGGLIDGNSICRKPKEKNETSNEKCEKAVAHAVRGCERSCEKKFKSDNDTNSCKDACKGGMKAAEVMCTLKGSEYHKESHNQK